MIARITVLFALLLPGSIAVYVTGSHFNYDNPYLWVFKNPLCSGKLQSPIALYTKKAWPGNDITPLAFQYYDVPFGDPIVVANNGHTVQVKTANTTNGKRPNISGGGLTDIYELQGFHYHWGSKNKRGSEHAIDGKRFDLEMHIVHKNSRFPTMDEAMDDPFGLVVLAIFFKGTHNCPNNNTALNAIYDVMLKLSAFQAQETINETITMQTVLGNLNTEQFFTYRGSLTTPPCSETVTWFIFPEIQPIDLEYLQRFWTLYDYRGKNLLNNYRPIQSNFLRRVYYRKGGQLCEPTT